MVFATPGMLHAGQSLQIFKKWAGNEKNMVSPGFVPSRTYTEQESRLLQKLYDQLIMLVFLQVIMPGYCVQGTIGHKILNGQRKLELEGRSTVEKMFYLKSLYIHITHLLNPQFKDILLDDAHLWVIHYIHSTFGNSSAMTEYVIHSVMTYCVCVCVAAGGEAAGRVHVVQRPRGRQGHHAADPHGGAPQHAAGARGGRQDGVPQRQDRTGVQ